VSRVIAAQKRMHSTAVLLVGGGALAVAVWLGGDHGFAVALAGFYVVAGAVAYAVAGGSGDVAAIMRTDGDERQRMIDHEATRLSGLAMTAFAIVGAIVQTARGADASPYLWMCAVGGIAYVVALAVQRRRS
jgi:hypothetical protein